MQTFSKHHFWDVDSWNLWYKSLKKCFEQLWMPVISYPFISHLPRRAIVHETKSHQYRKKEVRKFKFTLNTLSTSVDKNLSWCSFRATQQTVPYTTHRVNTRYHRTHENTQTQAIVKHIWGKNQCTGFKKVCMNSNVRGICTALELEAPGLKELAGWEESNMMFFACSQWFLLLTLWTYFHTTWTLQLYRSIDVGPLCV